MSLIWSPKTLVATIFWSASSLRKIHTLEEKLESELMVEQRHREVHRRIQRSVQGLRDKNDLFWAHTLAFDCIFPHHQRVAVCVDLVRDLYNVLSTNRKFATINVINDDLIISRSNSTCFMHATASLVFIALRQNPNIIRKTVCQY